MGVYLILIFVKFQFVSIVFLKNSNIKFYQSVFRNIEGRTGKNIMYSLCLFFLGHESM